MVHVYRIPVNTCFALHCGIGSSAAPHLCINGMIPGMNVQSPQKNQGIQVISRAASVLRALGKETDGLSLGQIANRVDLPRSTVQRIVGALSDEGFISVGEGGGRIKLGPELLSLGMTLTERPLERLRPVVKSIAQETGETVDLAVLRNGRMLFVDQVVGRHRLRTVSSIGETFPLTTTANGKAALACLDEVEATNLVLKEVETGEDRNVPIAQRLTEIANIRDGALAMDEDEHTEGISALGFGIADPSGEIFALSVPVPSSRYKRVKEALIPVLETARRTLETG